MGEHKAAINKEKIGRRITTMRLANGLTRSKLAEEINRSDQTLSSIEYGHKGMSVQTLCDICVVLGITPNYLLGWSKYPTDSHEEHSEVYDEISEMLRVCDDRQIKTISSIIKLYVDDVKKR